MTSQGHIPVVLMHASTMAHPVSYVVHRFQFDAIFAGQGLPVHEQRSIQPEKGIRLVFVARQRSVPEKGGGGNPSRQGKHGR